MLSIGVCSTRHWYPSGLLVQEVNVCTVVAVTSSHSCQSNINACNLVCIIIIGVCVDFSVDLSCWLNDALQFHTCCV